MTRKPWLVERQRDDGTWEAVEPFLTAAQASAVATLLSWQKNVTHRHRFQLKADSK
jgi:hypothetical protein